MKKYPVLMTGPYRSGTEFALQLISGTKETSTTMYNVNAFRYLPNDRYIGTQLIKSINKIAINLKDSSNIRLNQDSVISILKEDFPSDSTYCRSQIYHAIINSLYLNDNSIDTWVEKTQLNWTKTSEFLEKLPNSRAIFIYRDPRGAMASFKKFTSAPPPAYLGTIFNYLSFFQTLTALLNSKYKERIIYYSYEKIIENPQKYRYIIQDFLGKPRSTINNENWRDSDGNPWKSNTTQDENSIINNPQSLIYSWKKRLNPEELTFSERILSPYLKKFGFECLGLDANIDSLLNSLSKHPSTKLMFSNYLETGGGLELFPTNPNQ
tara:strand:+ start:1540 stop:2508 length:969 start_codon:yes stop_codon:yes gene_type:complete